MNASTIYKNVYITHKIIHYIHFHFPMPKSLNINLYDIFVKTIVLLFAIQIIIIIVHIVIWSMFDGFNVLVQYENNVHIHF